jgi:hypothetical protein
MLAKHNFTDRETVLIPEETKGGTQNVRYFSKQGVFKMMCYSNTEGKDEVVDWLIAAVFEPPKRALVRAARHLAPLPKEGILALDEVLRQFQDGTLTVEAIKALQRGDGPPLADPLMDRLAVQRVELSKQKARIEAALRENNNEAVFAGYSDRSVQRHVKQLARANQLSLSLDTEEG